MLQTASDKSPDDIMNRLNPAQRAAATYGQAQEDGGLQAGPLLVIAGAGTGKTMTLAHRVAHLIMAGVAPDRILLLTFTRRAAEEMTRRVEGIVRQAGRERGSGGVKLPWSGTFHAIGNRLLRQFAGNLGLDPAFSVLDRGDAADVMDVARHELGFSAERRRFPRKDTCLAIYSRSVNTGDTLKATLDEAYPWCLDWEAELKELFRAYVQRKQAGQLLDYDDLLLYWQYLVAEEDFARSISAGFEHILVDEYQDTNRLQARILSALRPDGSGLTVVGDDAQSIYSFRAADVENILGFPDQFMPSAQVISLEENYRSTQAILESANRLIAESERQYRKNLFARDRQGAKPSYVTVEDGEGEAQYVVGSILENREAGVELKQQAVLFRNSHHSDRLELELVRRNIPYVKYGGMKFLEAAHVKDLLAILKWAENPRNEIAAFRVLKLLPGMGPRWAKRCFLAQENSGFSFDALDEFKPPAAAAESWPGLCRLLQSLAGSAGAEAGWQVQLTAARDWYRPQLERLYESSETREADLEQLEQIATRYPARERFLTELTLDPPSVSGDQGDGARLDEDYLILSTIHSAKGQEWDSVFVLNVTDGNFPSEFAAGKPERVEEERRLLYVAMTRARQQLSLIAPLRFHVTQQHPTGDRHVYGARSRFLSDSLMDSLQPVFHGSTETRDSRFPDRPSRRIDAASRALGHW
ncbi:MAG: ATP-dependent helicase [Pseudomonadota bacterium]